MGVAAGVKAEGGVSRPPTAAGRRAACVLASDAEGAKPARAREATPCGLTTKQWLSHRLADLAGFLATTIPLRVGYWLADRNGDLFYRISPGYRGNVIDNLRHVLDGADGAQAPDLDLLRAKARLTFRYSSRNFYDLMRVRRLPFEAITRDVTVIGSWEPVDAAAARGRGVIFVTGHFGAFDFAGQLIPLHGYRTVLVTVRTVSEFVHEGVTYLRGGKGFDLEEATPGGLRRLMRSLRRGDAIGLATDRDFLRNGVPVRFFGEETTLPIGAVRLALETGAPIVLVVCRRHGRRHTFTIEEPFWVTKSGDAEADLHGGMERLVALLESHIRATPEQWVMFQRVWPRTPPPTIAVFPVGSPLEGRVLGGEASSQAAEPRPPRP